MTKKESNNKKTSARNEIQIMDIMNGFKDRSNETIVALLDAGLAGRIPGGEWQALVMLEELTCPQRPSCAGDRSPESSP